MAERRMFAKTIIDSDAFLEMPLSSQSLYFHLCMRSDDEGMINNPRKIQRMIGASDDDLRVLIANRFLICFDSGIVAVKHWRINNYIQKDRLKPTVYKEERALLRVKENGAYTLDTSCIQSVSNTDTQVRLGKDRLGKDSLIESGTSVPPALEDVAAYCRERKNGIDPQHFLDYYTARGWKISGSKMEDWKSAVRSWETREKPKKGFDQRPSSEVDIADITLDLT